MKRGILVFALMMFSSNAWAGHDVGNGGDVVDCTSQGMGVELLDHYEARVLQQKNLEFGPGPTWLKMVEHVTGRLGSLSPLRSKEYLEWATKFLANTTFTDEELTDIPDSQETVLPKGCKLRQIAIQNLSNRLNPRYKVNRKLWEALTEQGRAGLVLHEIIYREALLAVHTDSRAARAFNGILSSRDLESMSLQSFERLLLNLRFQWNDVGIYKSSLIFKPRFYQDGSYMLLDLRECTAAPVNGFPALIKGSISFHWTGKVKQTFLCQPAQFSFLGQPVLTDFRVIFFKSGELSEMHLPMLSHLKIGEIESDFIGYLEIEENLNIIRAKHTGGFSVKIDDALTFDFVKDERLKSIDGTCKSYCQVDVAGGHFKLWGQQLELEEGEHDYSGYRGAYDLLISKNTPLLFQKKSYSVSRIRVTGGYLQSIRLRVPVKFKIKNSSRVSVDYMEFRDNGSVKVVALAESSEVRFKHRYKCKVPKGKSFGIDENGEALYKGGFSCGWEK